MRGQQCSATSKRTREQCRRFCPPGFVTCKWHGSGTAKAIAKAGERVAEAEAVRQLAAMGEVEPCADPVGRLQLLAGEADALLAFCRHRFTATEDTSWLVVYAKALESTQRQLADLAKLLPAHEAAKAEADEAVARQYLDRIGQEVKTVMDDDALGLLPEQKDRLKLLVACRLRDGEPTDPPPARAGLRGADLARSVLDLIARRGPRWTWSDDEQRDVDAIVSAAQAIVAVFGVAAEPIETPFGHGTLPALGPGGTNPWVTPVDDAEVVP